MAALATVPIVDPSSQDREFKASIVRNLEAQLMQKQAELVRISREIVNLSSALRLATR